VLGCAIIYILFIIETTWTYHVKTILQMSPTILFPLGSESLNVHKNGLVGVCVSLISLVQYLGSRTWMLGYVLQNKPGECVELFRVLRRLSPVLYTSFLFIYIYLFTAIGLSPGGSVYFTCKQNIKLITTEFKSGGLYEKHVVATWNVGNRLSICL